MEYVAPATFGAGAAGVAGMAAVPGALGVAGVESGAPTVESALAVIIVGSEGADFAAGIVATGDDGFCAALLASVACSSVARAVGLFDPMSVVAPQLVQKRCPASRGLPHCEQKRGVDCAIAALLRRIIIRT